MFPSCAFPARIWTLHDRERERELAVGGFNNIQQTFQIKIIYEFKCPEFYFTFINQEAYIL